jgi:hypothetical protein
LRTCVFDWYYTTETGWSARVKCGIGSLPPKALFHKSIDKEPWPSMKNV